MKGWVLVDPEDIQGDDQLAGWIQRATKFVGKLAGKRGFDGEKHSQDRKESATNNRR